MGYMYPIQHFFTFKVGKTPFRGLSLSPLSGALCQLYLSQKKGVILFKGSLFKKQMRTLIKSIKMKTFDMC